MTREAAALEPIDVSMTCWLYSEKACLVVVSDGKITEIPWKHVEAR
jgi:hypothetical protein